MMKIQQKISQGLELQSHGRRTFGMSNVLSGGDPLCPPLRNPAMGSEILVGMPKNLLKG